MHAESLRTLLQQAIDGSANAKLCVDGCEIEMIPASVALNDRGELTVETRSSAWRTMLPKAGYHAPDAAVDGRWLLNPERISAAWIFTRS